MRQDYKDPFRVAYIRISRMYEARVAIHERAVTRIASGAFVMPVKVYEVSFKLRRKLPSPAVRRAPRPHACHAIARNTLTH